VEAEQPAHILQIIHMDEQLAWPTMFCVPATGDRRQSGASVFVRDQLELRPVGAAGAALTYIGEKLLLEGGIIAGAENGRDLPLNPAKILQTIGVRPRVGLSKAALVVWHCAPPAVCDRYRLM
jgi:hypothetical protein